MVGQSFLEEQSLQHMGFEGGEMSPKKHRSWWDRDQLV